MTPTKKILGLHYTNEEWEILEHISREKTNGKLSFYGFLSNRMHQFARTVPVENCQAAIEEVCIPCNKKKGQYIIPPEICEQMIFLSNKHCISLAAVVDRFIVSPLFNEYRDNLL